MKYLPSRAEKMDGGVNRMINHKDCCCQYKNHMCD